MATGTESFTKPDGNGLGNDLTWSLTDPDGDWATASNVGLIDDATTAEIVARAEFDTGSADMYAQVVLPDFGNASYGDLGLCVRMSSDRQTYYNFKRVTSSGGSVGSWEIRKYVSGVQTTLVDGDAQAVPFDFPETVRIEVEGDEIRCYINEVLIDSLIDTDIAAGSFGGLNGFRNGNVFNRRVLFDDFEVGSLGGSPPTPPDTPTSLAVSSRTATSISLGWDPVSGTTYELQREKWFGEGAPP